MDPLLDPRELEESVLALEKKVQDLERLILIGAAFLITLTIFTLIFYILFTQLLSAVTPLPGG